MKLMEERLSKLAQLTWGTRMINNWQMGTGRAVIIWKKMPTQKRTEMKGMLL
jgi:hypothetical protein